MNATEALPNATEVVQDLLHPPYLLFTNPVPNRHFTLYTLGA